MRRFEIQPKVGLGPIRFGMTRAEVRAELGAPESEHDEREWYLEDMAVDFDADGRVEFIETAESAHFEVVFMDSNMHAIAANAAVVLLQTVAPYDDSAPELGYSYIFPSIQLSLWRPVIPDAEQDPEDQNGRRFEAIGIGREGYFDRQK